jgi:glyoxylase-like metal-dependent hydrolase (beta-lactamase superfamily II)
MASLGIRPYHNGLGDPALLVDTLFDVRLTAEMLAAMRRAAPDARIDWLMNTHSNGDHCNGTELVTGAQIIASKLYKEFSDDTTLNDTTRLFALMAKLHKARR